MADIFDTVAEQEATGQNIATGNVATQDIFDEVAPVVEEKRNRELSFRQGKEPSAIDTFFNVFKEKPEVERVKAQNAMAMSEVFGISPSEAYDAHDAFAEAYAKQTGLALQMTPSKFYTGLALPAILTDLTLNPAGTLIGLAKFEAAGEAVSAVVNYTNGTKYKAFQKKGWADLLPEDANVVTKGAVEVVDFLSKALIAGNMFRPLDALLARKGIELPKFMTSKTIPGEYNPSDFLSNLRNFSDTKMLFRSHRQWLLDSQRTSSRNIRLLNRFL